MPQRFVQILIALVMGCALSACVYKIPVQQGTIITDAELSQIHQGMTVDDVQDILGEPLLQNIYADDRAIYAYTFKKGHRSMQYRRLIIQFQYGRVESYHFETNGTARNPHDTSKALS